MSTFVLLLMTTCVPSLDPIPADSSPSYGEGGRAGRGAGGRRGFFGRIRGIFTRRSRGDNAPNSANARGAPTTGAVTATPPPPLASGDVLPAPVAPAVVSPAPVTTVPWAAPPQRMPVGTPLPQGPTAHPF